MLEYLIMCQRIFELVSSLCRTFWDLEGRVCALHPTIVQCWIDYWIRWAFKCKIDDLPYFLVELWRRLRGSAHARSNFLRTSHLGVLFLEWALAGWRQWEVFTFALSKPILLDMMVCFIYPRSPIVGLFNTHFTTRMVVHQVFFCRIKSWAYTSLRTGEPHLYVSLLGIRLQTYSR